ncbi:hypothetical protein [Mucilaginibacter sp. 10B2]|uniref:hypothetical protein n=1 Tax=Mucilaginibacter sp. 10B2 TaxID=3048574 RepID=UPI002B232B59|nr:hypothetical protein [Mucilaginibacter sp. 10B2]MEB0278964.1 hypothetical protein [Mucilaginibacter sp. 10B2]
MELPSLINQVLKKAAPTSALENDRINNDCRLWYEKLVKDVQTKQDSDAPLTLIDKGVKQLDSWYVRLIFAMSYFVIIRFIQDLMNPGEDHQDEEPSNFK